MELRNSLINLYREGKHWCEKISPAEASRPAPIGPHTASLAEDTPHCDAQEHVTAYYIDIPTDREIA